MKIYWAACLVAAASMAAASFGGDWPHWRGPELNGVSRETSLPESWDPEGENVLWKANVGGMSSPIVMNGRVYVMGRRNEVAVGDPANPETLVTGPKTQETVVCMDANTGKILWTHGENVTQSDVPFHRLGWSSVTGDPETGNVYALGCQCTFMAFEGATGKLLWKRQMTEEFGLISTFGGRTPSPLVDEDQVIIGGVAFGWGDNARGQHRVFAFNKKTGELNWSSPTGGPPVDTSQTTPVVAVIDGVRLIITVAGDGGIHAFQARTGKKVWSYQASKRGLNTTPLVDGSRIYVTHSEENTDTPTMGRAICLDVSEGKPKLVWKVDGLEAGFASPTLHEGRLYVPDNKSTVHCLDASDGKVYWKKTLGTIGRPSMVFADGKLYAGEANGRMQIWKLGESRPEVLSKVEVGDKLGREYAMFGSPAIANGRIYMQTATTTYCIGPKEAKVSSTPLPEIAKEAPVGADAKAAFVRVTPSEVTLRPGEKVTFKAEAFDALGRSLGAVKPQWEKGPITLMATPPNQAAATTQPQMVPVKVGNLGGEVTSEGVFTAEAATKQGGAIVAKAGDVTGFARVRVLPALPWNFDFEDETAGRPPLVWVGAGGKFAVRELVAGTNGDARRNKVLVKTTANDLYARARTNFGHVDMSNYTLQADVQAGEKLVAGQRQMPDVGIINSKYVLVLMGNHQRAQIHVWSTELPDERKTTGSLNKTISFKWEPNTVYRMKLQVQQESGKAVARGKVWPATEKEPADWTLTLEDDQPNTQGSPGVYGNSLVGTAASEIIFDNIVVTQN